jgi:GNAT superfamily N-acetyltransferase
MCEFMITRDYVPGSLGSVVAIHAAYYHEHWGFGLYFEAKIATELAEFLQKYEPGRDGFWTTSIDGRVEGSIAIDGTSAETTGAHLRWFIVSEVLRGKGAGNRLIGTAMSFCRQKGYRKVHLWTFEGLDAAKHLYEKEGFVLVEQRIGAQWGTEVREQRFELSLDSSA